MGIYRGVRRMGGKARHTVRRSRAILRDARHIRSLSAENKKNREEKERYYTERQILFDQANNWRIFLANKYIKGEGIEIGATYLPLPVPHEATVRYIDIVSEDELYELYPDLRQHKLTHVDIIDDGEKLASVGDKSQDFIIANHFLEHTVDPIGTLQNFYRVLRSEGIIYMCIPDKRYTFDIHRDVTPLERLIDFHAHPDHAVAAKPNIFLDVAQKSEYWPTKKQQQARAQELMDQNFSIHYNVWRQHDLLELLLYVIHRYKFALDIEAFVKNGHEMIAVVRKDPVLPLVNTDIEKHRQAHAKVKKKQKRNALQAR